MCNAMEISSVEKVFAVAELTEIILGFATCSRKLKEALELRQVCQSWKGTMFHVLVATKKMLTIDIGCPQQTKRFFEIVSRNSEVPISVRISNPAWRRDQLRFLRTYANSIVTIKFVSMPTFDLKEIETEFRTMDMNSSRFTSILIAPPSEQISIFQGPLTNFVINRIQSCATRTPLNIMCADEFTTTSKTHRLPLRMDNFTLMYKTWNDATGKLLMASTSPLSSLAIYVNDVENDNRAYTIETVVKKFSNTLESLVLSVTGDAVEQTELTNMKKLKSLEMRNIALQTDRKITMPLLENLCIMGPAGVALDNLTALTSHPKSNAQLKKLTLQAGATDEQLPVFFVERFTWVMLQAIESAPSLEVLDWRQVHMQVANVVLPVVFRTLRGLSKLSLEFLITNDLMSCDLTHLLTGVSTGNVPKSSNDWIKLLIRSRNRSIIMLQCLEEFEISNSQSSSEELIVSPLIFKALSGIRSLTTLTFKGYITIDNAAATSWLNANPLRRLNDFTKSYISQ